MCGISAVITNQPHSSRFMRDLLLANEKRGKDSTGVWTKDDLIKAVGGASTFLKHHELPDAQIMLGHCRFATTGAINVNNAHPFEYEGVALVHNGIIYNYDQILVGLGIDDPDMYAVDSKCLLPLVVNGCTSLSVIEGSANFIAVYKGKMYVNVRGMSLYYWQTADGKVAGYSSEPVSELAGQQVQSMPMPQDTLTIIDLSTGQIEQNFVLYQEDGYAGFADEYWPDCTCGDNGTTWDDHCPTHGLRKYTDKVLDAA